MINLLMTYECIDRALKQLQAGQLVQQLVH